MSDTKNGNMPFDTRALYLSDVALKQGIDLLLTASRNLVAQNDSILQEYKLGQAHARALYFIASHPGLTVADLLGLLSVTKQSLSRVLSELLKDGYVVRRVGQDDRRQRTLHLTDKGVQFTEAVWQKRRPLMAEAFRAAGQDAVAGFRTVLIGLGEAAQDAENDKGSSSL